MSAADTIVDALTGRDCHVKTANGGWTARCPAHNDRDPSLSVHQIEGQALVYCHAGCDTSEVMAALNLTLADLYDTKRGATYTYDDGRLVHRLPGKRFWQDGIMEGTGQLYRFEAVKRAVADGEPVYVVEGEKDVHALESVGAVATTSPMGAGKWHKVDSTPLHGGNVVIVADRDTPGERHASDVATSLDGKAASVCVVHAKVGKDAADHVAAGYTVADLEPAEKATESRTRQIRLTPASQIEIRPVHWLWKDRMPQGSLILLAGREGIGKSTVAYTLAAQVTRGRLDGRHAGEPKAVIVAATEDSWEHTIAPRLVAAGADLERVYRCDVTTWEGSETALSLPRDLADLEQVVRDVDAALILLDPLMSRLDSKLDSHKDAEVRLALEPLVAIADRTKAVVLGVIHVNKSTSTDPLTTIMASRAFAAVARAVLFVIKDPDDESVRMLGEPKNNLARTDLPTLAFTIESAHVKDTDEGPVWSSRIKWLGESDRTVDDALRDAGETPDSRTATSEAVLWLEDYLTHVGGTDDSKRIKEAGAKQGLSLSALQRARVRLRATISSEGRFPGRKTFWTLPGTAALRLSEDEPSPFVSARGESEMSEMNGTMGRTTQNERSIRPSVPFVPVVSDPARAETNACARCGQPLLLTAPGRTKCARCERLVP